MNVKFLDLTYFDPPGQVESGFEEAYYDVVESGNFIGGKEVEAFEQEWAAYCGVKYCVGVGNGHDALALACRSISNKLHLVDPVVQVPWKTCLPTWAAVRNGGCHPVSNKLNGDFRVAVHIYGGITLPDNYDKATLVEDCAQAHGSTKNGIMAGKFGAVSAWSFYPTKNLGALGDAGAITTDDQYIYETVRCLHDYGTRDYAGINSRLDPLQAAFLLVKLKYLDEWNARRKENAQAYLDTIAFGEKVTLPYPTEGSEPNWHIFAIETDERDNLKEYLRSNGVETKVHYPTPPYPTYWVDVAADNWTKRTLSLPVAPHVTPEDCIEIGMLINQWMGI